MNKLNLINYIFLVLLLISCKNRPEEVERTFLNKSIELISIPTNYEWIVIIPGAGCHGCIQEGELFMKRNIENRNILYILTKTSSIKILQQKTGIRLNEHPNVYLDTRKQFDIPTDNAIYPCIVEMKNGSIISHIFQKPGNDAFRQIKKSTKGI